MFVYSCFFFFSSRRRHTSSLCDWSSDVCSSDLRWRVRTIDRDDVHAGEHLIETLPIRRGQLLLDPGRNAAAVVVVDLQPKGAGAARHRLADPPHADDAEPLAPDAVAEHPGGRPARPRFVFA